MVARPRRAVPGLGAARPRLRRPARRDPRRRCPTAAADASSAARAARAGWPWSAGRTSASPACSTGSPSEERAVVDSVAGTTVDPVDSLVRDRRRDLAARRHRRPAQAGRPGQRHRVLRVSLRTAGAIEAAEVAVVLLDAGEPISEQDQRVLVDGGRGRPGAGDRLQQVGPGRRGPPLLPGQGDRPGAAAASRGRSGSTSPPRPAGPSTSWRRRCARRWRAGSSAIPTGAAQPVADRAGAGHAAPGPRRAGAAGAVRHPGRHARRRGSCCSRPGRWTPGYLRFIERKLREEFGFEGSPIEVSVRPRKKTGPGGRGKAHG